MYIQITAHIFNLSDSVSNNTVAQHVVTLACDGPLS